MANGNQLSLTDLDTFGDVAAEDDAVLDYFLETNAVDRVENNEAFLVLGRKGAGKTAIVRYFTEGSHNSVSKALNLRGYPWGVHAQRIDHGASEIEAYVSSWRYLISVQLAGLVLSHARGAGDDKIRALNQFFSDNYGGSQPQLADILRPPRLRLTKLSLQPSIIGNQLGGVELDRKAGDLRLGLELNALSESLTETSLEIASNLSLGPLILHFDELDQGLSELDENRSKMLIGLILASREVKRESENKNTQINPVVYLRSDLWDDLQFSDKNKISQTLALHLEWSGNTLLELVETRLRAKMSPKIKWDDISTSDLMRGSQKKWDHILARTFLRPRDVIQFLNVALAEAKKRTDVPLHFKNPDIVSSRDQYSAYLKKELDDEILPHWPFWEEALQACSAISTITFDRDEFIREYNIRRSEDNTESPEDALRLLYRFSVVGYERRSGYGGSSWAFQYIDPEAGWDNGSSRFKVHLGLKEYAKLRETRQ